MALSSRFRKWLFSEQDDESPPDESMAIDPAQHAQEGLVKMATSIILGPGTPAEKGKKITALLKATESGEAAPDDALEPPPIDEEPVAEQHRRGRFNGMLVEQQRRRATQPAARADLSDRKARTRYLLGHKDLGFEHLEQQQRELHRKEVLAEAARERQGEQAAKQRQTLQLLEQRQQEKATAATNKPLEDLRKRQLQEHQQSPAGRAGIPPSYTQLLQFRKEREALAEALCIRNYRDEG